MRISPYLDEDSHSSSLIQALRYRGLDVTTAREAQMVGSPIWSSWNGLVRTAVCCTASTSGISFVCTATVLHGKSHAGIILAQQQSYSIGEQMRRLLKLVAVRSVEEMIDQVEFLSGW